MVLGGGFGGKGQVAASAIVGGSTAPFISPGVALKDSGRMTLSGSLIFNSGGTYDCSLDTHQVTSDQIAASFVNIKAGAHLSFISRGTDAVPVGTVFTVINNTGASPIGGTFDNLPDGSILTVGSNTFQVDYEGGDGNDLTLTVVP